MSWGWKQITTAKEGSVRVRRKIRNKVDSPFSQPAFKY